MEETRQTPEIVKKWSEETTRHAPEQPEKPSEDSETPPVLVAISWGFIVIGLLALAIMIYDAEVFHVCFKWRKWLFIILLLSGLSSLRIIWDGEDLLQTNKHGKKIIKPSIIRGAFKLTIGIARLKIIGSYNTKTGVSTRACRKNTPMAAGKTKIPNARKKASESTNGQTETII